MLVSTRGRYALRIILELSSRGQNELVSLSELSEKQNISLKYAESIVALLVKAQILEGHRGKAGGYRLLKTPAKITVGEILKLTEDSIASVTCLGNTGECPNTGSCKTFPMWRKLDSIISDFFAGITIEDLITGRIGE